MSTDTACKGDIGSATETSVAALASAYAGTARKQRLQAAVAMDAYPFVSGVVIYGEDEINTSYPTYCDHYHLYSFYYNNVTPLGTSDTSLDLSVHGWTMTGFPNACTYVDWSAIDYPLVEDVDVATTGDQFAWTCGYYTEYEWSGYESVYFEIASMNALAKTVTTFALVAVTALLL